MASTPQYVRTGGQTYELTPGGYYKKTTYGGQAEDIGSFGDWYTKQAQSQYDPLYQPIKQEQSSYYDTIRNSTLNSNKSAYANAGLMDSSFFANKQSQLDSTAQNQKAAALARLDLEKSGKMSSYVESLRGNQMQGDQWEQQQEAKRQEAAQQQAQWEQEMAWKREQMAYEQQQSRSKGSGGSSSGSSTSSLKNQLASLSSKYRTMDWGQMQQELQGQGIDPVYFRDWVYQNALKENPKMSQSAIRNLVYKQYFPDGWR